GAMKLPRRRFLHLAAGAVALPAFSRSAEAQAYPTRPITMIVPLAAGGPLDAEGRILAEKMRDSLGRPIIIENVNGEDGSIGVGRGAGAKPDGYTLTLGSMGTLVFNHFSSAYSGESRRSAARPGAPLIRVAPPTPPGSPWPSGRPCAFHFAQKAAH